MGGRGSFGVGGVMGCGSTLDGRGTGDDVVRLDYEVHVKESEDDPARAGFCYAFGRERGWCNKIGGQDVFDRGQRHCNPKWTVRCF